MVSFQNDYLQFVENKLDLINQNYPTLETQFKFESNDDLNGIVECGMDPFRFNRVNTNGYHCIGYDENNIQSYNLDRNEQWAIIAHEIGHKIILYSDIDNVQNEAQSIQKEIECDKVAIKLGLTDPMRTALSKLRHNLSDDMYTARINALQNA